MAEPLLIIGAGGFGREVHDVVIAVNAAADEPVWDFLGFLDDGEVHQDRLVRRGAQLLGSTADMDRYRDCWYVVGIGNPQVRSVLADRADTAGLRAATLVHPSATIGLDVEMEAGCIICSHASITTNVRLGRHVHLDQNVALGHDVRVGDFVRANPGATISGDVELEAGVTVGTNAAIIQGLTLGAGTTVGAGAAVVKDVPAGGHVVVGVPARALR